MLKSRCPNTAFTTPHPHILAGLCSIRAAIMIIILMIAAC